MKVVIIEDERRSAERLKKQLLSLSDNIEILNVLPSVGKTIEFFNEEPSLDLIFADIQLSDGLSFDVFEKIQVVQPIIFTTAYDSYAIRAFKANGIDYLLKPIDVNELSRAVEKYHNLSQPVAQQDLSMLKQLMAQSKPDRKSRFLVRAGEHIQSIPVEEIFAFYSQDKATYILDQKGKRHLIDQPLEQIHPLLEPKHFFRINRKYIVHINSINKIHAWSNSRMRLELHHHSDDVIIVARDRSSAFKEWLDQ